MTYYVSSETLNSTHSLTPLLATKLYCFINGEKRVGNHHGLGVELMRPSTDATYMRWLVHTEHQNFFGVDDNLGPVAVSLRREKIPDSSTPAGKSDAGTGWLFQYRLIVRTSEVCRLCYLTDFDGYYSVKSRIFNPMTDEE